MRCLALRPICGENFGPRFRQQVSTRRWRACRIGEPKADPALYPRLAGARDEARAVAAQLTADGALDAQRVKALISPDDPEQSGADALTVINALLERAWRIVHIAGHGEPPELVGAIANKPGGSPLSSAQQLVNPRGVVLRGTRFWARARFAHGTGPNWCSSTAVIWRRGCRPSCCAARTIGRVSPPTWPKS